MRRTTWVSLWLLIALLLPLWFVGTGSVFGQWSQVNEDGFGPPDCDSTLCMAYFNGRLYAGTANPGKLYRTDGSTDPVSGRYAWEEVTLPGSRSFPGRPFDIEKILDMIVLERGENSRLYVLTDGIIHTGTGPSPYQVLYRTPNGTDWGDNWTYPDVEYPERVTSMADFNGYMYIALEARRTVSPPSLRYPQLFRDNGDSSIPSPHCGLRMLADEDADVIISCMKAFNERLYLGTSSRTDRNRTAEIWRAAETGEGENWERVAELESAAMYGVQSMEVFGGRLYAGTKGASSGATPEGTGPQLWRTDNGTDWNQVAAGQFNSSRTDIRALKALGDRLYVGLGGVVTPPPVAQIYRSSNGTVWEEDTPSGLTADSNNVFVDSMAVAWGDLFFGTGLNTHTGTEVWRYHTAGTVPMPDDMPGPEMPESGGPGAGTGIRKVPRRVIQPSPRLKDELDKLLRKKPGPPAQQMDMQIESEPGAAPPGQPTGLDRRGLTNGKEFLKETAPLK